VKHPGEKNSQPPSAPEPLNPKDARIVWEIGELADDSVLRMRNDVKRLTTDIPVIVDAIRCKVVDKKMSVTEVVNITVNEEERDKLTEGAPKESVFRLNSTAALNLGAILRYWKKQDRFTGDDTFEHAFTMLNETLVEYTSFLEGYPA
jgi:hypothetical protein